MIARGDEILELPRIPTGSLSLDVETGGGVPIGRITSFVGEWSSGKTTVTLKIAGNFQKLWPEKDIYWIDAEGVFDPKWARTLGLDAKKIFVVRPDYGEQAYNIALEAMKEGAGLVVIDSISALASKAEVEGDMDKVHVAPMAKINGLFLKKITGIREGDDIPPTLIYLNQLRQNVGGYGPPLYEPGGEALNFYPSLKVLLKKGDMFDGEKTFKSNSAIEEGDEPKAQVIKFFTEKNKTAPFKRRGYFWFYFDHLDSFRAKGTYDRLDEVIRYTQKYGVVQRRGSIYDLINPKTGEVKQFKGVNALAAYIRANSDTQAWVEDVVTKRVLEDMTDAAPEEVESIQREESVALRAVGEDDEAKGADSSKAV